MSKRKNKFHRMSKSFMKFGLFFVLSGLFIGGTILPAYAKEGDRNQTISKVTFSDDGQTIVEEMIVSEDGEDTSALTENHF